MTAFSGRWWRNGVAALCVAIALGLAAARAETPVFPPPPALAKGEVCAPRPAPTEFVSRQIGPVTLRLPKDYVGAFMGFANNRPVVKVTHRREPSE